MGYEAGSAVRKLTSQISLQNVTVFYYIAFTLYAVGSFLRLTMLQNVLWTDIDVIESVLQNMALVLLVFKFMNQRLTVRGWLASVFLVFAGFLSWRLGNEGYFFWLILFVVCSEGIEIKRLATIVFCLVIVLIVATVGSCLTGVIENREFARSESIRYAWGFRHPNTFGSCLVLMCVSFSTIRFGKNPFPDFVLLVASVLLNLVILDSRSSLILLIAQIGMLVIFRVVKSKRCRKIISLFFLVGVMALIIASVILMVTYDSTNPIHHRLNDILSLRLSLAHDYYSMQPISLFGSDYSGFDPIYWENGEPAIFLVDNAFAHLVLRSGVIPGLIFLLGLISFLIKYIKDGKWDEILFGLVLITAYGVGETLGIRLECNYFLVAAGAEFLFGSSPKYSLIDLARKLGWRNSSAT